MSYPLRIRPKDIPGPKATDADLNENSILTLDTPNKTKPLPANLLAKQSDLEAAIALPSEVATESDMTADAKLRIKTPAGEKQLPANLVAKQSDVTSLQTKTENISESIASEYNGTTGAVAGEMYMHEGMLYYCNENTSGDWDNSKFIRTDLCEVFFRKIKKVTKSYAAGANVAPTSNRLFYNLKKGEKYKLTYTVDSGSVSNPFNQEMCVLNASGTTIIGFITDFTDLTDKLLRSTNIPISFTVTENIPILANYINGAMLVTNTTLTLTLLHDGIVDELYKGIDEIDDRIDVDCIPDGVAKTEIEFNSDGSPSSEKYLDSSGNIIREDLYDYGLDSIVQTIKINNAVRKTITMNTKTMEVYYAD